MAYLKVGIHEDLVLTPQTKVNDKGSLELHISSKPDEDSMFNAFANNESVEGLEGKIIFFPPNMTTYEGPAKTPAELGKDIFMVIHKLKQYCLLYGTEDQVNAALGGFAMFDGLVDTNNKELVKQALQNFTKEEFLLKVLGNLYSRFIMFIQSVNGFEEPRSFRQKFIRQSANKHYPTISNSDFDIWLESMDIPKEASKIKWSDWEIKNKKNDPTPVEATPVDTDEEETVNAENMFGDEGSEDAPDLFSS